mgnify:CR=1 FL=1
MEKQGSREGLYSCDLVPHPEGRFFIGGISFRPEWGRDPLPAPVNRDEIIRAMVVQGVKEGQRFYDERKIIPDNVHVEAWSDVGAVYVSVNKPKDWKLVR